MLACALAMAPASAQVQRTFINLGFEEPVAGAVCHMLIDQSQVPGWLTTHFVDSTLNFGCAFVPNPTTGRLIEIWAGDQSVVPRAGNQNAELNANEASRIYQNICLTNGETVSWRLSHRGRQSDTTPDVMAFGINPAGSTVSSLGTTIATIGTTNSGVDRVDTGGTPSSASLGTIAIGGTVNGWRDYSGTFTWTGATAVQQMGFAAVSSALTISHGNFIDDIQVTLRPYLELAAASVSIGEGQAHTYGIRVLGTVPAGGITVPVQITGGTAVQGTDYTIANVFVPAGTYDNNLFALPLTITNDNVIEDNETITLTLQPNPAQYTLTSSTTCGAVGIGSSTVTIFDNDVDVRTTKSVGNANPTPGGTTTFTVTYQNNTARPTVGAGADLAAHDATVTLADALPAGFSAFSWTCAASGTPTPACPAPSGTGAINTSATLPAGNGGAAGGVLTYTVVATVATGQCTAATNTSSLTVAAPFQESTSVQPGFTTPAPGGATNNTASAAIDPGCITLNKVVSPAAAAGPFNFTLTNTGQTTGTATTPAGGTVQVDGDTGQAGVNPYGIAASGAAVAINESASPASHVLGSATCTGPLGAAGTLAGTTLTLPAAAVTPGADFTCTFTNVATGSITIVLDAVPNHPQDFPFTTTGTGLVNFTLDDDADGTLPNTRAFTNLAPGTYTLTEVLPTGWDLSNYLCTPSANTSWDVATEVLVVNLQSNDAITCTAENKSRENDLSISNTNTPGAGPNDQPSDTLVRGQATTYTLVVSNAGPAPANNALVQDTRIRPT